MKPHLAPFLLSPDSGLLNNICTIPSLPAVVTNYYHFSEWTLWCDVVLQILFLVLPNGSRAGRIDGQTSHHVSSPGLFMLAGSSEEKIALLNITGQWTLS